MTNLDLPFFAASLAMGWGLSLATYRIFAVRNDWPMGEMHANKPLVPVLLGVFALAIAFLFAAFRAATPATELGGWWILPTGLLWAFFWTGFMRVGSQSSLFLAPAATVVLVLAWISVRTPPGFVLESNYQPNSYTYGTSADRGATTSRRSLNGFGSSN
jgi:hypothetical protein